MIWRRAIPPILLGLIITATTVFPSRAARIPVETQAAFVKTSRWVVFADGGWVKVEKGRLGFYSASGNRRKRINLRGNEFLVGPFGTQAVGVLAYADRQPKTLHPVTFDLYASSGKRLTRVKKPPFSSAIVSPSGNAFVGIEGAEGLPKSTLRFYSATGKSRAIQEVVRFEGGYFTDDGSRFFFETGADGIHECAADGSNLRAIGRADLWAVSAGGDVIAIALDNRLLFYRDGRLVETLAWRDDQGTIRALAVSPNGNHCAVISATHAAVVDVVSAKLLWETTMDDPQWNLRSVDLINDAEFVALGLDYDPGPDTDDRHARSRCLVFDRQGRLLHTEEDRPVKWGARFPRVQFSRQASGLAFINRDRFKILGLNQVLQ